MPAMSAPAMADMVRKLPATANRWTRSSGFAVFGHEGRLGSVVHVAKETCEHRGCEKHDFAGRVDDYQADYCANAVAEDERGFAADPVGDEAGGQSGDRARAMKSTMRRVPMKRCRSRPRAGRGSAAR